MIDIHTHILPKVDDGCQSLEDALKMIDMEIANGVDTVILTPHFKLGDDISFLKDSYLKFLPYVENKNIKIELGSEIYWKKGTLELLKNNQVLTLGDTKYVLIEFNLLREVDNIEEVLYDVSCIGYKPILAHAERYPYLSIEQIASIKESGILIQVNTSSLNGTFGFRIKSKAKKLAKLGLIDIIASDCHSLGKRCPNLTEEYSKYIKEKEFSL